nr:hypothetical protein [uncultured Prevotella sp.]
MTKRGHSPKRVPIEDEENVARIIYSPSYIENGKVAPTAFRWEHMPSGKAEDYISVLRNNGEYDLEAQSRCMRPRNSRDTRHGYALLKAGDIRRLNNKTEQKILLEPKPSKKNKNHAGIYVYLNDEKVTADTKSTPELMFIQKLLADLCTDIIKFEQ